MSSTTRILISDIEMNGGTQTRAKIDADTVRDYADAMTDGATFPAITVFYDGTAYWLADGFHRLAAAKGLGWRDIDADVKQGTCRDAILYSVGANALHGLRRTNADKRRAVECLLNDEEWSGWSDRKIAEKCGVSHEFVRCLRPSLSTVDSERTYTTKHGTQSTMQTANIGKRDTPVTPMFETPEPSPARSADTRPARIVVEPQMRDSSSVDDNTKFAVWLSGIEAAISMTLGNSADEPTSNAYRQALRGSYMLGDYTISDTRL